MGKHVGILVRSLERGGAEKQAIILGKELGRKHRVTLFVLFGGGSLAEFARSEGVTVIEIAGGWVWRFFSVLRFLEKEKINVLFTLLPSCNILGGIAGKIAGVKVITGIRNEKLVENRIKRFVDRFIGNWIADAIVSNSYSGARSHCGFGFRKDKIHVIPNGISVSEQCKRCKDETPIKILTVGRFVHQKGYDSAIRVIAKVVEKQKNLDVKIVYWIAGYGPEEEKIKKLISTLRIDEYVKIWDGNSDLVKDLFSQADIFFSASRVEGVPNTIMEAMAACLPVVCTRAGDSECLLAGGRCGAIRDVDDIDGLANALFELVSAPDLRKIKGELGYERIKDKFSPEKMVESYERLLVEKK